MTRYDRFITLCRQLGVTPSRAMVDAGLSKALASKWKAAPDLIPNGKTLSSLASYFNVSVDYFLDDKRPVAKAYKEMPEITELAKAARRMSPLQRQELLSYAKFRFPEVFEEEPDEVL